ncbi:hypothetical protein ACFPIJ_59830 [Dactylosporangium cerinum]|uniref:FHA domain-containing protein n=1 Tax=Dactylosporangium cerinum TaxID=1434730 RepID=A0ABV9WID2_9ACTN
MSTQRLRVAERIGGALRILQDLPVPRGRTLSVGRTADVDLGADPPDRGVSRHAVVVATDGAGWQVEPRNRGAVLLYEWGLPPRELVRAETVYASRVALQVTGGPGREHWVLLEDAVPATESDPAAVPGSTDFAQPRALTPAQRAALEAVFADFLEWPPRRDRSVRQLKVAAASLYVSATSLRERLTSVVEKANRLGLGQHEDVLDPAYLHLLVRRRYLEPPG